MGKTDQQMVKRYKIFLPVRSGSERVLGKNTRNFAGNDYGLLGVRLKALLPLGFPIVVSTDDTTVIEIINEIDNSLIKLDLRPKSLCLSSTKVNDLIHYVGELFDIGDTVIWCHVTAPFLKTQTYRDAISEYENNSFTDSLMTVSRIQQFIWDPDTRQCINNPQGKEKWPRTQDLKPYYEINHAFYINSVENYRRYTDRIGVNPFLFELNRIESFDIDWEDDFILAERLFRALK